MGTGPLRHGGVDPLSSARGDTGSSQLVPSDPNDATGAGDCASPPSGTRPGGSAITPIRRRATPRRRYYVVRSARPDLEPVLQKLILVWAPQLVWIRLYQLWRHVHGVQYGNIPETVHQAPPMLLAYAESCGIVRRTWRPGWHRPLTRCLACGRPAWRLYADGRQWRCPTCWPIERPHADRRQRRRTEVLLSEYGCGLRIGLTGQSMRQRRARLIERLARLAVVARDPHDLWLLAMGGPVVQWRPTWNRHPPRFGPSGPVKERLRKLLIPCAIDQLLHPMAYLARFGGRCGSV
jgi:hypothetical protein